MFRKYFDLKFLKFLLVGVANTLLSMLIMFGLYNLLHMGYWVSSAVAYVLGSILSFILNRNFTFQNRDSVVKTAIKFALNVAVCYMIAYSVAKPAVIWILSKTSLSTNSGITEQIAMLFGMVLFTLLNYFGQRLFAFRQT